MKASKGSRLSSGYMEMASFEVEGKYEEKKMENHEKAEVHLSPKGE